MNKIATRTLEIAYEEFGDSGQPAVILLHGWPDDAHTWRQVNSCPLKSSLSRMPLPSLTRQRPLAFRSCCASVPETIPSRQMRIRESKV
jgi:pimeloyl-ACP methyl ester carboxylesterase